ncbi:RNA polymerase sigma-70 factor [Agriterribacter sp.]|uniref:RNA polymerase sigma-70 factor n=1 Tax=Agriterribacter sp. TaxID=2821509 RepID=UPI002B51D769|nr:RNA polymerase sigma-70 factor [Agriterribacter sp.]HRO46170.1 RNA polymerase sigma-70 factor [Agriterribacter sp.]HRQ16284.1 RNA polymerase sigma-70 factor [Agriterribacter sp.]
MDSRSDITNVPVQLMHQIAAGNEQSFKKLYDCFYKKLYHFAFAIVKTKEAAEEVVEDVFIKIWKTRKNFTDIRNIKVYLYTATKNTSLNFLAKKAKENITQPFDHIDIEVAEINSPETLMITAELYKKIQRAVEALPPRCKIIFKLVREDKLKYREVADILNISINTIDAQMAIAVKKIMTRLRSDIDFPIASSGGLKSKE